MAAVILESSPYTSKSIIIHGYLYNFKILFQAIQIHCLSSAHWLVLGMGLGEKCELYYQVVQLQKSERSFRQNNNIMLDLVIRHLEISHQNIILKDQHLIFNNKVYFCVCKYNNYYFDTKFCNYGE